MSAKPSRFLTIVLFAAVASGQNSTDQSVDRVIYLASIENPRELAEIATTVRSIGDIRSLSVDNAQRALSVHGTAEQIALVESLVHELAPQAGESTGAYEYKMSSGDLVRVFYLPHTATVQEFQAVTTMIRTITNTRWTFTYNARRAVVVRGTLGQMEMTEWMVQQMNQPSGGQTATNEYHVPGAGDDVVRVYYVKHAVTTQNLQELTAVVRTVADVRQLMFKIEAPTTVAMRGTDAQMTLAEWLFQQLDQPASGPGQSVAPLPFVLSGSSEGSVRVFFLKSATVQDFQDVALSVRGMVKVPRVAAYNAIGALAVRGTPDEMAQVQNLIEERFKRPQR